MINISLLNNSDLHEDLIIQVGGMSKEIIADSYYFYIGLSKNDKPKFRELFKRFLTEISLAVERLQPKEQINIPITLYDEYTGFICIKNFNPVGVCNIYYCSAHIEGWKINPWINDNFQLDKDLIIAYRGGVDCNKQEIINGLQESISKLIVQ